MATLVYSDADGVDRSFALGVDPVLVGRGVECAIRSDDPRVSRQHARFFVDHGALWIEDLGSSNGIFVGPNKVQRAPVPTGEIILVGSLMIRLLPASGTLPPPVGLHGTLATWLDLERKTRSKVEEERDAFAKRVGELHRELTQARSWQPSPAGSLDDTQPGMAAEAFRMRDEAEARAATLEKTLAVVQDEVQDLRKAVAVATEDNADLGRLRDELALARDRATALETESAERAEWSSSLDVESGKQTRELQKLRGELDEAESARSVAEHAHAEASREAQQLRDELDNLRRSTQTELEAVRLELAKAREAKMMADTVAGVAVAEKLAEADLVVQTLQRELVAAKTAAATPDSRVRELTEQLAIATGRAEKAEKDFATVGIRSQGAERNLAHASAQAAKAETRSATLEQKLADAEARVKTEADELARARERIAALETRLGAGDAPLQAAEARAAKLAAELVELQSGFETRRDRIAELDAQVADAKAMAKDAETKVAAAKIEVAAASTKLAEADQRTIALQTRLDQLGKADVAIAAATRSREEAAARAADADTRVAAADRRADDAEKRASAADTMAKAMAKDVAEALRRAAEADSRARTVGRELAGAHARADKAEALSADVAAAMKTSDDRIAEAEARADKLSKELEATAAAELSELKSKITAEQKELKTKLESTLRELAAERSTAMGLVDRRTQLERDLADARAQLPALIARAEAAEKKLAEDDVQIETLLERVTDLESGMAVSETASHASLTEAREEIAALHVQLAEAKAAAAHGAKIADELKARVAQLEQSLADTELLKNAAENSLREARAELADLTRLADSRAGNAESAQEALEDARARAGEAERKIDALTARAEAADLAIGRAAALQRQLDEAIQKLAWLEREGGSNKVRDQRTIEASDAVMNDRIASADARAKEADARTHEAEARVAEAEQRIAAARQEAEGFAARVTELERRLQQAEQASRATSDHDRRAAEADARIQKAEQSAVAAQRQLADAVQRIAGLEREVESAENVRSFAAETEREIAQFQREINTLRSKLTQMTLERDRLESDLRHARSDDSETTSRRLPTTQPPKRRSGQQQAYDPEATAHADLSRYTAIIAKADQLEKQVERMDRENRDLKKLLADTEGRLRAAMDGDDDDDSEATRTGNQLPIALAEHVSTLEESIDSLRANMRAASDETAMMDQSDSVVTISTAVSQAAEHIERARAAVRALQAAIGYTG